MYKKNSRQITVRSVRHEHGLVLLSTAQLTVVLRLTERVILVIKINQ